MGLEPGNELGLNATLALLREQVYGRWTLHGIVSATTPADIVAAFHKAKASDPRLHEVAGDVGISSIASGFAADDIVAVIGSGDRLPRTCAGGDCRTALPRTRPSHCLW